MMVNTIGDKMLRKKIGSVGIIIVFLLVLAIPWKTDKSMETGTTDVEQNQSVSKSDNQQSEFGKEYYQQIENTIDTILNMGTNEFFAGYPVNDSFLLWVADTYGEDTLKEIASTMQTHLESQDTWYELTGNSMHVLWLLYGKDMQFASYKWEDVKWIECKDENVTRIDFTGDINLDESWYTMTTLSNQSGNMTNCIDEKIQQELQNADISVINNEFTFSDRGEALKGKAYTFRANPDKVSLLETFGADVASLANNHVYDYGQDALLDTITTLENAGISTIGAGENIEEAKKAQFVVANGKKIGFVSATEIEKFYKYTKEATSTEPGVLKTLDPEKFLSAIREADSQCDYVIVYVHWGIEGWNQYSTGQRNLAAQFIEAGADVVIGGHPHRLQGIQFIDNVPVAYSLGNFWFSTRTLYTTIAQIQIEKTGELSLQMIPCIQQDVTTRMLIDWEEKEDFYNYLADVSTNIAIDEQGRIYDTTSADFNVDQLEKVFYSGKIYKDWQDDVDLDGYTIDIVGNRTS